MRNIIFCLFLITAIACVSARRLPHKVKNENPVSAENKNPITGEITSESGIIPRKITSTKERLLELLKMGAFPKMTSTQKRPKRSLRRQLSIQPEEGKDISVEKNFETPMKSQPTKPLAPPQGEKNKPILDEIRADIIGGVVSDPDRWKWMVAVYNQDDGFVCGGTLIDLRWVLTAAHCVHRAILLEARIGAWNLSANDQKDTVLVSEIHVNPYFQTYPTSMYDIALLHLAREANVSVSPEHILTLPDALFNLFELNPYCFIIGWGAYDPQNTYQMSTVLLERWVTVISAVECQTRWDVGFMPVDISFTNLCIDEGAGDVSACFGDSGSPLQCYDQNDGVWKMAGLSSWGSSACSTFPSVYTKVAAFLDWIELTMYPADRFLGERNN